MAQEDKEDTKQITKLIHAKRGGRGPKISQHKKMWLILRNLTHIEFQKTEPGFTAAKLLRISLCNDKDRHLLDELETSKHISSRPSKSHERGDKFYYKTENGVTFEKQLAILFE